MSYFTLQLLTVTYLALCSDLTSAQISLAEPARVAVRSLPSSDAAGMCPLAENVEMVHNEIRKDAEDVIYDLVTDLARPCTGPEWRRVAFIDMKNVSQTCPSGFVQGTFSKRTCIPSTTFSTGPQCTSTRFDVNGAYNHVCGRIIGYTINQVCAFRPYYNWGQMSLGSAYVGGVSLTSGSQHIWTFASGQSEIGEEGRTQDCYCPCAAYDPVAPPPFVGDDYFCESGLNLPFGSPPESFDFFDDPIWDGRNCPAGSTCCEFNSPPWFNKTLPREMTGSIQLRVCSRGFAYGYTPIELIELYVQ